MTSGERYMIRTVSDEWLREQTTTPSTYGWYRLMVHHLNKKNSTRAYTVNGKKVWNQDAVMALLRTPPNEL